MKNTTTIKNLLGLTQEETAMLLGVTRGQWSMYDAGKRSLPSEAIKKLAVLLSHLKNSKPASKERKSITVLEQQKTQEWLKREHLNVQYKTLLLDRQLLAMENKRAECFAALEVAAFLELQHEKGFIISLAKIIKLRATNTLLKNALHKVEEMRLKKENLEVLKTRLEEKMKEY